MSKWINWAFTFVNASLMLVAGFFIATRGIAPASQGFEYKDLIAIILTVLAVILGAVTLFMALIAIWGYNAIREAAQLAARDAAKDIARVVAKDVAQAVATREAQGALALSGETTATPDIKADDGLNALLQAGDQKMEVEGDR
jgi:hypothetical protein